MTPYRDAADRDAAQREIGRSRALSAGAGAGKTHTLVQRLSAVVDAGLDDGRRIVAITFTERAARDLTNKLRVALGDRLDLDRTYVGTIHGFCMSILRRFPLEAGLPPVFSAESEVMNRVDAAARRTRLMNEFFDAVATGAQAGDTVLRDVVDVMTEQRSFSHFADLVEQIEINWDRFETARLPEALSLGEVQAELARLSEQLDPANFPKLRKPSVPTLAAACAQVRAASQATSLAQAARRLHEPEIKLAWKTEPLPQELAEQARRLVGQTVFAHLLRVLVPIVVRAARQRQQAGRISFDDILVLTRALIERDEAVRARLRAEIAHLCVDEFQDTDPVQYRIVRLLTDPEPDGPPVPVLFAVGDPKQSIYSFRHADVTLFGELQSSGTVDTGMLTENFRSRPDVLAWINPVFDDWFGSEVLLGQVPFAPLHARVPAGPASVTVIGGMLPKASSAEVANAQSIDIVSAIRRGHGHWIVRDPVNGAERPARYGDIAVLVRRRADLVALEPELVAAGVPYVVEGGTLRYDTREVRELLRILRAINDPSSARTVIAALRTTVFGLSDVELVEHRAHPESRWDPTQRDAVGHPAVVDAFRRLRGWIRMRPYTPPPDLLAVIATECFSWAASSADSVTKVAMWRRLRTIIDEARDFFEQTGGSLSEYLDFVSGMVEEDERGNVTTDERDDAVRILTIHAAKGLDFPVVIVAGLGFKAGGPPNTQLHFVTQPDGSTRVEGKMGKALRTAGLPAHDTGEGRCEATRLTYVACTRARDHLVVCAHWGSQGSQTPAADLDNVVERLTNDGRLGGESVPVAGWVVDGPRRPAPEVAPLEPGRTDRPPARPAWRVRSSVAATQIAKHGHDAAPARPRFDLADDGAEAGDLKGAESIDADQLDGSGVASLDLGESIHSKPPRSTAALPEQVGRYGTAIGRAVHGVLQHVDLTEPRRGLAELVTRNVAAEAVPDAFHGYVAALVDSILASEAFARLQAAARVGTVRREMYVGAAVEGVGVYGIIDAIWTETDDRGDTGLVVLDFKTDHALEPDAVLAERYTPQLQAYGLALTAATGRPVTELMLAVAVADGSAAVTIRIPPADRRSATAVLAAVGAGQAALTN